MKRIDSPQVDEETTGHLGRANSGKNVREPSGRQLTRNVYVAATFVDGPRLSPFGNCIHLLLVEEDLMIQACQVQFCTC